MSVSTLLMELRLETPAAMSWPGLHELAQAWNAELQTQGFGQLLHASRKRQEGCATEADLLVFELRGEFEKLVPVVLERLRQFQVPISSVVTFQETSFDGAPCGPHGRYTVLPVHDEPDLHPWGWSEQAMMAAILTELHREPRWRDLSARMEAPLPRFVLMGMGQVDLAALAPPEAAAFLAAAEQAWQKCANDGPSGWTQPERFPDWLQRFRNHLNRWRQQVAG